MTLFSHAGIIRRYVASKKAWGKRLSLNCAMFRSMAASDLALLR
jgi:hypothetical protein